MKLIYSNKALVDLQRLYKFLSVKNINSAKRARNTIIEKIEILRDFPYIGKRVRKLNDCRDLIIPFGKTGYVARYEIKGEKLIRILAIKHQLELGDEVWD